ncbi:MAG: hypothetical protein WDM89_15160 [Rhizomicrobium sp.]
MGEALIAKNRSDLALAKFEDANRYAPNWGRLHLKWGEALVWSGRSDDAKKQFALARTLDLMASEKVELARWRRRMADEKDRDGQTQTASGAAVWSALGASSAAKADAFLDEQIILTKEQAALARLQAEDLRREDRLRHRSLRLHHLSDMLKLGFELALAAIFTAVLFIIAGAVWSAAHEDGLVIEAFSVPPDLANSGLTGQAAAAKLQDKLSAMQAATGSARPAASYSNNWGNDIKSRFSRHRRLDRRGLSLSGRPLRPPDTHHRRNLP